MRRGPIQQLQLPSLNTSNGTTFLQLSQDHLHGQSNGFQMFHHHQNAYTPPPPPLFTAHQSATAASQSHYTTLRLSQEHLQGHKTMGNSIGRQSSHCIAPALPVRNGTATLNSNRCTSSSRIYH